MYHRDIPTSGIEVLICRLIDNPSIKKLNLIES